MTAIHLTSTHSHGRRVPRANLSSECPLLVCVRATLVRVATFAAVVVGPSPESTAEDVQFQVSDAAGDPVPCRIHIVNSKVEPQKAVGQPFWHDHFVCSGAVAMDVPAGSYTYQIERGPEWSRANGTLEVDEGRSATADVTLNRIASLRDDG